MFFIKPEDNFIDKDLPVLIAMGTFTEGIVIDQYCLVSFDVLNDR